MLVCCEYSFWCFDARFLAYICTEWDQLYGKYLYFFLNPAWDVDISSWLGICLVNGKSYFLVGKVQEKGIRDCML